MEEVARVVRAGFGRNLDFADIYQHITAPEEVYLLRSGNIKAMASYNTRNFYGLSSLIVEGIALIPEIQGRGVFRLLTQKAIGSQKTVCLRTQNPRMYRALEKLCGDVYPTTGETPENMGQAIREFAAYTKSSIDDFGVVRGYYGGLFYGQEPTHCAISRFFKEDLKMDLSRGDAVLVMGLI